MDGEKLRNRHAGQGNGSQQARDEHQDQDRPTVPPTDLGPERRSPSSCPPNETQRNYRDERRRPEGLAHSAREPHQPLGAIAHHRHRDPEHYNNEGRETCTSTSSRN